jgi:hypothetical protein
VVCGILSLPQSVMRRVNTSIRPIVRRASETTVYRWNAKFGGLTLSDAKRVRQLEAENSGLKRLLAEARLDDAALQGPARKKKLVTHAARRRRGRGLRKQLGD